MKKHNGMRPQDISILLKIVVKGHENWQNKDLANELLISQSEISESLNRSVLAGLIDNDRKSINKQSLMEFIEFGFHYVFPAQVSGIQNGIYTGISHPFMKKHFHGNGQEYVWPYVKGKVRGLAVEPLYKEMASAALIDDKFYKISALLEVIRIGKIREWKLAINEIKNMML